MEKFITIRKLVDDLSLEHLTDGKVSLDRKLYAEMVNRPGLELAGVYDNVFDSERVIVIGLKETNYLSTLSKKNRWKALDTLISKNPPCVILSANQEIQDIEDSIVHAGVEFEVPILRSELSTTPLLSTLYSYLHKELCKKLSVHGVFVDILGMGTLITGKSGIGKSEVALELVKQGYILISDDLVEVYQVTKGQLIGSAPKILERYLEVRGIGVVDVVSMFGVGAYRKNKRVSLIVELEKWDDDKTYDRLGVDMEYVKMFDTYIPKVVIPVVAGRNVAALVEAAARNVKLKEYGYNAALTFTNEVAKKAMNRKAKKDE